MSKLSIHHVNTKAMVNSEAESPPENKSIVNTPSIKLHNAQF